MKSHFQGSETLQAPFEAVWAFFTDPAKVGWCIPDVVANEAKDALTVVSEVKVGVGPVKGKFSFETRLEPLEAERRIMIRIRGEGLGTSVEQEAAAQLEERADGSTALAWQADATIAGKLATFGGKLLEKQASKIIQAFFQNIRKKLETP